MENLQSNNWKLTGTEIIKTTEESHSGQYSLKLNKVYTYSSNNLALIDPTKEYILEGYFKGVTTDSSPTYLYFGFAEYDENLRSIDVRSVNLSPGTETVLTQEVKSEDREIHFYCDDTIYNNWYNGLVYYSMVAFEVDDSGFYNDLPNHNISGFFTDDYNRENIKSLLSRSGSNCTISYHPNVPGGKVGKNYPAGTKIRLHKSGGSYNYIGANYIRLTGEWQYFSGLVKGESLHGINPNYFRRGTKFIKILILPNRWSRFENGVHNSENSNATLYVDDLKLTVKK